MYFLPRVHVIFGNNVNVSICVYDSKTSTCISCFELRTLHEEAAVATR